MAAAAGTLTGASLASGVTASSLTSFGAGIALGTPASGNLVNCTFPELNQSTTGNAATATALQTARTINGVSFDGTANVTVAAAAGTLTGATLAAGVTSSSLTSFGTNPTATTQAVDNNTTRIATTAFVINQGYAKLASPTFTGTVTADVLTTTGNTTLGNASTDTLNVGNGGIVKDASGNVGIGASSLTNRLEVGTTAASGKQYARFAGNRHDVYIGQSDGSLFGLSNNSFGAIFQDSTVAYPLIFGTLGAQDVYIGANNTPRITVKSTGDVIVASNLLVGSQAVAYSGAAYIAGNAAADVPNTTIDVGGSPGKLCLVQAIDTGGLSSTSLYLLTTRVVGGGGTNLTATLISRSGSSTPTLAFSVAGTAVRLTVSSGGNQTFVSTIGV